MKNKNTPRYIQKLNDLIVEQEVDLNILKKNILEKAELTSENMMLIQNIRKRTKYMMEYLCRFPAEEKLTKKQIKECSISQKEVDGKKLDLDDNF